MLHAPSVRSCDCVLEKAVWFRVVSQYDERTLTHVLARLFLHTNAHWKKKSLTHIQATVFLTCRNTGDQEQCAEPQEGHKHIWVKTNPGLQKASLALSHSLTKTKWKETWNNLEFDFVNIVSNTKKVKQDFSPPLWTSEMLWLYVATNCSYHHIHNITVRQWVVHSSQPSVYFLISKNSTFFWQFLRMNEKK